MKKLFPFIVLSFLFLWKCQEMPDMSDPKDNVPPGIISNPVVENINGGAIITYSLPNDKDLLGVKAIYSLKDDGEKLEMYSSAFRDTIELKGFADTKEREVTLICIDKSYNESNPVVVKINPLTPPIDLIRETLKINTAFGGVRATWNNRFKENIALSLYVEDSLGYMTHYDTYYSASIEDGVTFRGLDPVEKRFKIEMRDRWDNYAEPLTFTLTPLFEEEILPRHPSTLEVLWDIAYGAYDGTRAWRGDFMRLYNGGTTGWNDIFNGARMSWGIIIDGAHNYNDNRWAVFYKPRLLDYFPDSNEDPTYFKPAYFIFDLKEEVIPSRIVIYAMFMGEVFPNSFEVWGTNSTPKGGPKDFNNITESLNYWTEWYFPPYVEGQDTWKNDWIKLGEYKVRPTPSGAYADTELTEEDLAIRRNGYEMEVYPDIVGTKVRYLRFVYKDTDHDQCYTTNINIYGQYVARKW